MMRHPVASRPSHSGWATPRGKRIVSVQTADFHSTGFCFSLLGCSPAENSTKAALTPFSKVPYNPPPIIRGSTDWTMRGYSLLNLEMEFCDE
jgi:hypothetical protein